MKSFSTVTSAGPLSGTFDVLFSNVVDYFAENFERRGEVGASLAITLEGRQVVDVWGGCKTENGEPWEQNTLCMVFSATKGATALCAHVLADRGLLALDAPITRYWPEFGVAGKANGLVSMALDHSLGVPALRDVVATEELWDYEHMVRRVAHEPAFWLPGTRVGYHALTMAWTVGELVRRTSGRRLGDFFATEIAGPLALDFHIGLAVKHEPRVAPVIYAKPTDAWLATRFMRAALQESGSPTHLFMRDFAAYDANSRACRAAEIGAANGVTNARGLARLYACLANGGYRDNIALVGSTTLDHMARVASATDADATLLIPTRFTTGFMLAMDNRNASDAVDSSLVLSDTAFGHVGAGGSVGFADPDCNLSFGYAMNRMGTGILMNARGQGLIDGTYRALGYRGGETGLWQR